MAWNNCIVHIILAIASYLFWIVAALSGGVCFALCRTQPLFASAMSPESQSTFDHWGSTRYKLTTIYLLFGLLLFMGALIAGFLKANVYWNYKIWEIKIVFSIIVGIYYFVVLTMILVLELKKYEKREQLVSVLALAGTAFMVCSLIINSFSELHHYL